MSETEHPTAADGRRRLARTGFADGWRYHAARPDYPEQAVRFLVRELRLDPQSHLVDLGAGTGILTRQLLRYCGQITALEPTEGMRSVLAETLPSVRRVDGCDTDMGLRSGSADAVTVAQAFHWFDAPEALREIHRVLVPGGRLGLIWNERDESVDWVRELTMAMRWHERRPYGVHTDYSPVLAEGPFHDIRSEQFRHRQRLDHQGLLQRVLSTSYIAVMEPDEREEIMSDVARLVGHLPDPVDLPYVTVAYRATADERSRGTGQPS